MKFKNYDDAISWLYQTQYKGMKLGLQNTKKLFQTWQLNLAKNSEKKPSPHVIHVAGTNGKGSVCANLASLLEIKKYSVGIFTSPHLIQYRERIVVDGKQIPEAKLLAYINEVYELIKGWQPHPTFFELSFAFAWKYFCEKKVDFAVIEVGLGGRLDSTNVVKPEACVFTQIGFDHQHILGENLTEIASEKAHIIKPQAKVISQPQEPAVVEILQKFCRKNDVELICVSEIPDFLKQDSVQFALPGSHQKMNAFLASRTLEEIGIKLTQAEVVQSVANVHWQGRFQILGDVVLDGAHNPDSALTLCKTWQEIFGDSADNRNQAIVIFGSLQKKNFSEVLQNLLPLTSSLIITTLKNERGLPATEIYKHISVIALAIKPVIISDNFATSLGLAKKLADKTSQKILVTGSLHLIGEALAYLNKAQNFEKSLQ